MTLVRFLTGAGKTLSLASWRNNSLDETNAEWVKLVGKPLSEQNYQLFTVRAEGLC